jgi:hypothetical protein
VEQLSVVSFGRTGVSAGQRRVGRDFISTSGGVEISAARSFDLRSPVPALRKLREERGTHSRGR